MTTETRQWEIHKETSDILWQAFLTTQPGTQERAKAKDAYLQESREFWGEESLGITQLQGRIDEAKLANG